MQPCHVVLFSFFFVVLKKIVVEFIIRIGFSYAVTKIIREEFGGEKTVVSNSW